MTEESNTPGVDLPGIDPTHSPAMRKILVRHATNRLALRRSRERQAQASEALALLVKGCDVIPRSKVKAAGAALVDAPNDKRAAPFRDFTDALVAAAKAYPPEAHERAALLRTVHLATELLANAQAARVDELTALECLRITAREAEAQHDLERNQGGGVH